MTKSLGKGVINLYSTIACGNQQVNNDLECDPFLNTAMQRFTCDLYYRFGAFLAPVSVGIITGKHYPKNSWIHFKYLKNILISRFYEQFSRNGSAMAPQWLRNGCSKKFQTLKL